MRFQFFRRLEDDALFMIDYTQKRERKRKVCDSPSVRSEKR